MYRLLQTMIILITVLTLLGSQPVPAQEVDPETETTLRGPEQPEAGPGGAEYKHTQVTWRRRGEDAERFWIYYPHDNPPETAPVVLFLHGWSATSPFYYRAWINHLVKRGNIVLFVRYHSDFTLPRNFTPNAIATLRSALKELQVYPGPKPDLDKFAIVGHSAGATVSVNIAGLAAEGKLPIPKALLLTQPGRAIRPELDERMEKSFPLQNLDAIPADTLMVITTGDADKLVADVLAKKIFRATTTIKAENKNLVQFHSDTHGDPPIRADHISPLAPPTTEKNVSYLGAQINAINTHDFFGYWKLFDALMDAAFYDKNRDYALGDTDQQRNLGTWSDGTTVTPLTVLTTEEFEAEDE